MQANILWTGREYYSLENCRINEDANGHQINSSIIGLYNNKIYKVEYTIKTDSRWNTTLLYLSGKINENYYEHHYRSDGKGTWTKNSYVIPEFQGCIDVDIALTPFTNTLPIKRLDLKFNESKEISVLYLDVLGGTIYPVRQKYQRISENHYHYQNLPNDFEALVTVDSDALVVDYPQLFIRTTKL